MPGQDEYIRVRKPKLTVEEQIAHLKSKGVTFDLCSEEDAAECLSDKTYYFKVAAYRALFDKRVGGPRDGEYVGLDFGHLRDLAAIDHMLRYTLLPMTLDIEYFAKVKLLRSLTERPSEDGYSIVRDYLASLNERDKALRLGEVSRLKRDRYGGPMATKYADDPPAWAFVEMLSFGGFASFYLFCARRWCNQSMKGEHYLLRQAQSVRNTCAHSTDIVNGFASREPSPIRTPEGVAVALREIGLNKRARRSKMANARLQQVTMVAYAYRELVAGVHSREICRSQVGSLEKRMRLHSSWYDNVDSVHSSFDFLTRVFDNWI